MGPLSDPGNDFTEENMTDPSGEVVTNPVKQNNDTTVTVTTELSAKEEEEESAEITTGDTAGMPKKLENDEAGQDDTAVMDQEPNAAHGNGKASDNERGKEPIEKTTTNQVRDIATQAEEEEESPVKVIDEKEKVHTKDTDESTAEEQQIMTNNNEPASEAYKENDDDIEGQPVKDEEQKVDVLAAYGSIVEQEKGSLLEKTKTEARDVDMTTTQSEEEELSVKVMDVSTEEQEIIEGTFQPDEKIVTSDPREKNDDVTTQPEEELPVKAMAEEEKVDVLAIHVSTAEEEEQRMTEEPSEPEEKTTSEPQAFHVDIATETEESPVKNASDADKIDVLAMHVVAADEKMIEESLEETDSKVQENNVDIATETEVLPVKVIADTLDGKTKDMSTEEQGPVETGDFLEMSSDAVQSEQLTEKDEQMDVSPISSAVADIMSGEISAPKVLPKEDPPSASDTREIQDEPPVHVSKDSPMVVTSIMEDSEKNSTMANLLPFFVGDVVTTKYVDASFAPAIQEADPRETKFLDTSSGSIRAEAWSDVEPWSDDVQMDPGDIKPELLKPVTKLANIFVPRSTDAHRPGISEVPSDEIMEEKLSMDTLSFTEAAVVDPVPTNDPLNDIQDPPEDVMVTLDGETDNDIRLESEEMTDDSHVAVQVGPSDPPSEEASAEARNTEMERAGDVSSRTIGDPPDAPEDELIPTNQSILQSEQAVVEESNQSDIVSVAKIDTYRIEAVDPPDAPDDEVMAIKMEEASGNPLISSALSPSPGRHRDDPLISPSKASDYTLISRSKALDDKVISPRKAFDDTRKPDPSGTVLMSNYSTQPTTPPPTQPVSPQSQATLDQQAQNSAANSCGACLIL